MPFSLSAAIIATIIAAGEVAGAVSAISSALPTNARTFEDKARGATVVIQNETQFNIQFEREYFDSGKNWQNVNVIKAFSKDAFTTSNADTSFGTGVSGGKSYSIGGIHDFSIGFSNPYIGKRKISVVMGDNPKNAYNQIDSVAGTTRSQTYTGKDKQGRPVKYNFKFQYSPGEISTVTISQHAVK